jgi:prepilin-type N-terminal cleavage/methylation domain-containing protein
MGGQRGFTLIEIMLAVAIVAILATVAISAYEGYIGEARIGTAMQDIRQAELILTDLALDDDLDALEPAGYSGTVLNVYQQGNGLILAAAAPAGATAWLDPWGRSYRYRRPPTRTDSSGGVSNSGGVGQAYDLYSDGPDAGDAADDIIRGCNGEYIGTAGGHTC